MRTIRKFFTITVNDELRWRKDTSAAIVGSLVVVILIALATQLVRVNSDGEAASLLRSIFPTTRFLASGIMTASATILALMVALLSFGLQSEKNTHIITIVRVKQLAKLTTYTFIFSIIFLCMHNLPIEQSDQLDSSMLIFSYYATIALAAINSGMLVAVVLLLFYTLNDMIAYAYPELEEKQAKSRLNWLKKIIK